MERSAVEGRVRTQFNCRQPLAESMMRHDQLWLTLIGVAW